MKNLVKESQVEHQVFLAVDCKDTYLPVDSKVVLEVLSYVDDGIFPSVRSWISFLNGNFRQHGELWLEGVPKESTIENWCYDLDSYKDKFVVKIGVDKYVSVSAEDLEFEFEYDINAFPAKEVEGLGRYPSQCVIYVTARIK